MRQFATQAMDFAGNGAGGSREGDRSEYPVGQGRETPKGTQVPSTTPEQEQRTGSNSLLPAVRRGCWLTSRPPWGPRGATKPGAHPGSPLHGHAGAGTSAGRAGGGRQKMNEGVGRLMALSGK